MKVWARIGILAVVLTTACGEGGGAKQEIAVGNFAHLGVAAEWAYDGTYDDGLRYVHTRDPQMAMWISQDVERIGGNMAAPHLRDYLGQEINREFGGANSRLSLTGNAIIRWKTEEAGYAATNWIIARPWSGDHILKLEITVEYDPNQMLEAQIDPILDQLDDDVALVVFAATEA